MNILLVNGIASTGAGSTDLFATPFRALGYNVIDVNQPIRHAWDVRSARKREADAAELELLSVDGDIVIAHSYGGIKALMAYRNIKYRAIYLFRPAVSRNWVFPTGDINVTCIYSHQDVAVWLGGLLMFKHPFGWAGTLGFKDPRVKHIQSRGLHNADFKRVGYWANEIHKDLMASC